jgi:hypothetical protein
MKNTSAAIVIAVAMIFTAFLLGDAFKQRNSYRDEISVKGLGMRSFTSDLIVWNGRFTSMESTLAEAFTKLENDRKLITEFFTNAGLPEDQLVFSSVDINKEFDYQYFEGGANQRVFKGYRLSQELTIESSEVDRIEGLSREVSGLIRRGVEFYSNAPRFYYTGLSELKLEMVAEATADARKRADNIAAEAGAKLGKLKNANLGVFQIIGENSNQEYSWGGTFNVYDKRKTATVTMRLDFEIN